MKKLWEIIKYICTDFVEEYEIEAKPVMQPVEIKSEVIPPTSRERLYQTAYDCLLPRRDVSPLDRAPDDVACVESVWEVYKLCFGVYPSGSKSKVEVSTVRALIVLTSSNLFRQVSKPTPGCIILNVTGQGNGRVSNGHIGICGKTHIMSNTSRNSYWEANYTYREWNDYFNIKGGMRTYYFEPK